MPRQMSLLIGLVVRAGMGAAGAQAAPLPFESVAYEISLYAGNASEEQQGVFEGNVSLSVQEDNNSASASISYETDFRTYGFAARINGSGEACITITFNF